MMTSACRWITRSGQLMVVMAALAVPASAQQVPFGEARDVGPVGLPGGTENPAEGTYLVRGAGHDIWGTADAFHYFHTDVGPSEDINARATITALDGAHAWTKVGIMLRHIAEPASPHHALFVTRSRGIAYQRRLTMAGPSLHTSATAVATLPVQLELMRRSGYTVLNAWFDGAWHEVAAFTSPGLNLFGLAVTSHDPSALASGTFEGVHLDTQPAATVAFVTPEVWQREFPVGEPVPVQWTQPAGRSATLSYSLDDGQSWTVVAGCAAVTTSTCTWTPVAESEAARLRVVVDDPTDRTAWNATSTLALRSASPTVLPRGWESGDVGAVSAAGGTTYSRQVQQFTVSGSGADIWGEADEFHFASTTVTDDSGLGVEITARVVSIENVHQWTKAGIMARAHRGAASAHVSAFATPTTVKGVAFQRRPWQGALSTHTPGPAIAPPVWLRIIIGGGAVRAYYKKNAMDEWSYLGEDRAAVLAPYEAGLAVTSHVDGRLARATFDNVSVFHRSLISGHADIGNVGAPGASGLNDTERTVWGAGADIWGVADAFTYNYGLLSGNGVISARVRSIEYTHRWAKAGVMMRSNLTPGSPHVMLVRTPGMGVAMQYRALQDGISATITHVPSTSPEWLRLRRQGNTVLGEVSHDGITWGPFGQIDLPLGSEITAGLAVTSHVRSRVARGVFEHVLLR
jgi:hypothetical protein